MTGLLQLNHDTITVERCYAASPSRVFAAYADPAVRSQRVPPSPDETIAYSDTDFRVGGTDHFLCGPTVAPNFAGTTRYEAIETDRLVACHERISYLDKLLSHSIVTWELVPTEDGTLLRLTDQITAFDAPHMIEGHRFGLTTALANLERWLDTIGEDHV